MSPYIQLKKIPGKKTHPVLFIHLAVYLLYPTQWETGELNGGLCGFRLTGKRRVVDSTEGWYLQGTDISHLGIFKSALRGEMLVPRRVYKISKHLIITIFCPNCYYFFIIGATTGWDFLILHRLSKGLFSPGLEWGCYCFQETAILYKDGTPSPSLSILDGQHHEKLAESGRPLRVLCAAICGCRRGGNPGSKHVGLLSASLGTLKVLTDFFAMNTNHSWFLISMVAHRCPGIWIEKGC